MWTLDVRRTPGRGRLIRVGGTPGRGWGCCVGPFLLLGAAGYLPRCSIHALLDSTVQIPVCFNQLPHLLSMLLNLLRNGGSDLLSVRGGNLEEGSLL